MKEGARRGVREDERGERGRIIYCEAAWLDYLANMDWQQAVSLLIIAATAGMFLWGRVRRRRFSLERDTHCGCASPDGPASKSSIVFRARKGERPQIIVKSQ
jgi:hypothetical protein